VPEAGRNGAISRAEAAGVVSGKSLFFIAVINDIIFIPYFKNCLL